MAPGLERWSAGTCRRMRAGTRESAAQAAVSLFPSLFALRSPVPRLRGAKRRKGAGPRLSPPPPPAFDWLLQLSIQNLFLMEGGVPPSLPQITFATSSQPVGPECAGKKRLGASELGPEVPRLGATPARARGGISCAPRPPPPRGSGAAASE